MTDRAPRHAEEESADDQDAVRAAPDVSDGVATTGAYETDEGVVLYDEDNPLAWVEADSAVDVQRMA